MYRLMVILLVVTTLCLTQCSEPEPTAQKYERYCGSCHLTPDPAHLPDHIWRDHVLPEMAARMGLRDPVVVASPAEQAAIAQSHIYPATALISTEDWAEITEYILSLAPSELVDSVDRDGRSRDMTQFAPEAYSDDRYGVSDGISYLSYDLERSQLLYGDNYGAIYHYQKDESQLLHQQGSSVISYIDRDSIQYITEIGIMNPSEQTKGLLIRKSEGKIDTLITGLHRPVESSLIDLNGDGQEEILICEFGHHTGALSLLVYQDDQWQKQVLQSLSGAIQTHVMDLNSDGRLDILALFAQGREGIYALYQEGDFEWRMEALLTFPPEHGISWYDTMDYDRDGDLDLVVANGDNADYSITLKPYHGIRIYENTGENEYEERWFYPLYGATRVIAEDFDQDGDYDIAVTAFFPDSRRYGHEGFVYLENINAENFTYQSQTTELAKKGRWLVMESGDFDQDGDTDIMLGHYSIPGEQRSFIKTHVDFLHLENLLVE